LNGKLASTYLVPITVGVLILCVTLVISYQFSQYQNEIIESNKEKFETTIENTISRREGRIETIASSITAFYANSQSVDPNEFDNFVRAILGENQEIVNIFTLSNGSITQSFPLKEHIGKNFDQTFSTYPNVINGKKVMTVEFPVNSEILLIIAVPFDYFVQEGVIISENYKIMLLSPIDDNVRLYQTERINDKVNHDVTFSEQELFESISFEHQTTLFGHKIRQNYDLKYTIWDASFSEQIFERVMIIGVGAVLSVIIPVLLIRSNLLKNQIHEKSKMLEKLNQDLIRIEKSKDEFVTMIVHDLKNPLVPIQSYVEILLMQTFGSLNEQQIQRLQSIRNNVLALHKMIQDLLDANKLELGRLKLDIQNHNLVEIIKSEITSLEIEFQKKGVETSLESPASIMCECDESRIKQVINNILLNSVDFVSEKVGRIKISLKEDHGTIKITIKDNGIGVPKDKIDNIFVKFYQIQPSQQRKYGGTGLGLAVCRGIIESHNGKIWAESEGGGKGTEIHIEIPVKQSRK
jgi:signal transduction histidine kinase